MREVDRAVEGIDVPDEARARVVEVGLLGDDVVVGMAAADRLEDRGLAGAVHLGHEVDLALVLDRDAARVSLALDAPGPQRSLGRGGKETPAQDGPPGP